MRTRTIGISLLAATLMASDTRCSESASASAAPQKSSVPSAASMAPAKERPIVTELGLEIERIKKQAAATPEQSVRKRLLLLTPALESLQAIAKCHSIGFVLIESAQKALSALAIAPTGEDAGSGVLSEPLLYDAKPIIKILGEPDSAIANFLLQDDNIGRLLIAIPDIEQHIPTQWRIKHGLKCLEATEQSWHRRRPILRDSITRDEVNQFARYANKLFNDPPTTDAEDAFVDSLYNKMQKLNKQNTVQSASRWTPKISKMPSRRRSRSNAISE